MDRMAAHPKASLAFSDGVDFVFDVPENNARDTVGDLARAVRLEVQRSLPGLTVSTRVTSDLACSFGRYREFEGDVEMLL